MRQTYRFIPDALNDKESALNDPSCHSEHGEESHSEKERKRKDNKQIKKIIKKNRKT